jgi:hypothetical protein
MDITKITDVKELKAMAFDEMQKVQVAQNNLQIIQQRIAQVQEEANKQAPKQDAKEGEVL